MLPLSSYNKQGLLTGNFIAPNIQVSMKNLSPQNVLSVSAVRLLILSGIPAGNSDAYDAYSSSLVSIIGFSIFRGHPYKYFFFSDFRDGFRRDPNAFYDF